MFQCFICSSEKSFDDLCNRLRHDLVDTEKTPLLEIVSTRPAYMQDLSFDGASGGGKYDYKINYYFLFFWAPSFGGKINKSFHLEKFLYEIFNKTEFSC